MHVLPDYIELSCRTPALALDPVPSPLSASPGACARCSGLDWSMLAGGSALFSGILKNYNLISTVEFSESGRQHRISAGSRRSWPSFALSRTAVFVAACSHMTCHVMCVFCALCLLWPVRVGRVASSSVVRSLASGLRCCQMAFCYRLQACFSFACWS